jgi:predicted RNase H-related nuclease YkuK (DUF458 family)
MSEFKSKFKKFGGDWIPDIIEYLKEKIEKDPQITIAVGCDSIQKRRRTIFSCTIMICNSDIRNGAHVVFFRENIEKLRDNNERLLKEAEFAYNISEYLHGELQSFYKRLDLSPYQRKSYKFHIQKCAGQHEHIQYSDVDKFISNINLNQDELQYDYKLVDIHLDYNPKETSPETRRSNKSHAAYKTQVPWLRASGYRTFAKNIAFAATSAADLLLQD